MSKWIEQQYAGYVRYLDGGIRLSVQWDSVRPKGEEDRKPIEGYVAGMRLKARFEDFDNAKAATERAAVSVFRKALADLTPTQEAGDGE